MLPTAMVRLEIEGKMTEPIRALGDTGSQPNLMVHDILSKNGFVGTPKYTGLLGISGSPVRIRRQITVKIFPWFDSEQFIEATFWVLPKGSKWSNILPDRTIKPGEINLSNELSLADPMFWKPDKIQLLFGVEIWAQLIKPKFIELDRALVQQDTKIGSVIMGKTGSGPIQSNHETLNIREFNYKELENLLKRMWEIEQVPNKLQKSREQELVEKLFKEQRIRDESGRFHVPILLQPNVTDIGDSRNVAMRRFLYLEKRFKKDPEHHKQYVEFMREYEKLGHMMEAKEKPDGMTYYIPHHGITSSSSFKVVFDCSCKTNKGFSLNDVQLKGQKLQRDLYDIILRSRRFKYGISVDVRKMYRQIRIIPEHWDLQRIFWREKSTDPIKEYYLVTVIYGQTSSPINAIMTMHEGANMMSKKYPRAVEFITQDFYMDDGFSGAETEPEAIHLARDLQTVFDTMAFSLDKWKSNSKELMNEMKGEDTSMVIEEQNQQSILGLKWNLKPDIFSYHKKDITVKEKWTRRTVLGKVASLYDPIGHLEPILLTAKSFVQLLWKKTSSWDEEIPDDLKEQWLNFWNRIESIEHVKIPRWVGSESGAKIELHGFSDASSKGSGVVIYVRTINTIGQIKVVQLTAKSKVAPIKMVSIPRLELVAATLLAKLMKHVRITMEWEHIPYYLWTDSMITLNWISKEPCELKTFVSNRVLQIQEKTEVQNWRHVISKDNPADLVSRGLMPDKISQNELWWQGPSWLKQPQEQWPNSVGDSFDETEMRSEFVVNVVHISNEPLTIRACDGKIIPIMEYSNKLDKILLICCYVKRFIQNYFKKRDVVKSKRGRKKVRLILPPDSNEKADALKYLIKFQQKESYTKELSNEFDNSELISLRPIIDDEGILRVGGRLKHAACAYEQKVPVIIPPKTRLSWLIMNDAHENTHHGHIQLMMQYIRERFWIPKLRHELRAFVNKCVTCKRYEHPLGSQLMGDLPKEKLTPCKPFSYTGVDYAGPIELKEYLKTTIRTKKAWIAIFVCLQTRAIYLDIVTDSTSAAFISCFRRFIGRKGKCVKLFSDNSTTFTGASKELLAAYKVWNTLETHRKLYFYGTSWQFMTPAAPHQGGIYEAAVKSAKYHLRRTIGKKSGTYMQLIDLLIDIEAILNSRPIYALTDDPDDVQALTPGHFLYGEAPRVPMPIDPPELTNNSIVQLWKDTQQMKEHFWERWLKDYMPTLQKRGKWQKDNQDYKIGQIVIIKDENLAPAHWLLGRIVEIVPSKDNLVRSVKIKTKNSILSRPVQKICVLPVETSEVEQPNTSELIKQAQRGSVSAVQTDEEEKESETNE